MNESNSINELQKRNQELLGKLAILQKQFDDALAITNAFDSVSSRNSQLEKDIRCYQSKNDDLTRRIHILAKTNSELIEKHENEKRTILSQNHVDISEISEKLKTIQCEHEKEQLKVQFQNQQNEQKLSSQIAILEKKLQKIYDASTQFFGTPISDVDSIITQMLIKSCVSKEELSHPQVNTVSSQTQEKITNDYEIKEKRLQSKIRTLKEQTQQLQSTISEQKNTITNLESEKAELSKSNDALKEKILLIQRSNNESQNAASTQIKDVKSNCHKLKAKLATTTQNTEVLAKQNVIISEQLNACKVQLTEKDGEIESLRRKVEQLKGNLRKAEKNTSDSDEIISNSKKTIASLQSKCQELTLASEQMKNELDDAKFEAKNNKKGMKTIQKLMENQNQDIVRIQSQRLHLISKIQQINSALSNYESQVSKILTNKRDPLPPVSFKYAHFPCEINESLFSIAYNQNMKDEDKLQSIYSLIFNFYNNQIKSLNETIHNYKVDIQAKETRLETILNELNKRMQESIENEINKQNEVKNRQKDKESNNSNPTPCYIQFNNQYPNCGQLPSQTPYSSNNGCPNNCQENTENTHSHFPDSRTVKNPGAGNTYNNFYNPCHNNSCDDRKKAEETISHYKEKLNKLKENNQKLIEKTAEKESQLNEILRLMQVNTTSEGKIYLEQTQNTLKNLQNKLKNKKLKHKKMKQDNQTHFDDIQNKVTELRNTLERTEKQLHENESNWEIEKQQLEEKNKELRATISKMKDKTKQYTDRIINLKADSQTKEKENHNYASVIENMKRELVKKESVIQQLRSFIKYYAKKQSTKYNDETELLKSQLNDIIGQLKSKNLELKTTLHEVKEKMNLSEKQYSKAKRQIADYCSKIQELEIKLETFHSDAERGKSLSESKSKATLISQELQFQSHLEESKYLIENAKRELMTSVALQFSSFFNANATIDSANFELFIQQLRHKFDKLTATENKIRSMLSLQPNESIESAIAILISNQNI